MIQFLRHLCIETRIRILESNILFRVDEGRGSESGEMAGCCQGVDVGPFLSRGAGGVGIPFSLEGGCQGCVWEEGEEVGGFLGGAPGVLGHEDVGLEVRVQEVEAASLGCEALAFIKFLQDKWEGRRRGTYSI